MRFDRLDLIATGPFTKHSIDLSAGDFGLHIVYGANEAGKSSSLRAITNFLYGFPQSSPDSFVHAYPDLRIGASIRTRDGQIFDAIRRKAKAKTLRDASDVEAIDESRLTQLLSTIDRDSFEKMFGIDHHVLRKAGAEISSGNGLLGETLFSSASGIVGLKAIQKEFALKTEAILTSTARSGSLIKEIKALNSRRAEIRDLSVTAEKWQQCEKECEEDHKQVDALKQKRSTLEKTLVELQKISSARIPVQQRRTLKEKLEAYGQIPLLPADFTDRCQNLLAKQRSIRSKIEDLRQKFESSSDELDKLPPASLLTFAESVDDLHSRRSQYANNFIELQETQSKLKQAEQNAKRILAELDEVWAEEESSFGHLSESKIARIRALGAEHRFLHDKLESKELEIEKLLRHREELTTQQSNDLAPANIDQILNLTEELKAFGDFDSRLDAYKQELKNENTKLKRLFRKLLPYQGELEKIADVEPPSLETIDRFETELDAANDSERQTVRLLKDKQKQIKHLRKKLLNLEARSSIPTLEDLNQQRSLRNKAWQQVKSRIVEGSFVTTKKATPLFEEDDDEAVLERFEVLVQETDQLADQLRDSAERVASKHAIDSSLQELEEEVLEAESSFNFGLQSKQQLTHAWCSLWSAFSFEPLSPREMRGWSLKHAEFCTSFATKEKLELAIEGLCNNSQLKCDALIAAFEAANIDTLNSTSTVKKLIAFSSSWQRAIDSSHNQRLQTNSRLVKLNQELAESEIERNRAQEKLNLWKAEWSLDMQQLRLDQNALPIQAEKVLDAYCRARDEFGRTTLLSERMQTLDEQQKRFEFDLEVVAKETGIFESNVTADVLIRKLANKVNQERLANERLERLENTVADYREQLRAAHYEETLCRDELAGQCVLAATNNVEQLISIAEQSQHRSQLIEKIDAIEEQLMQLSLGVQVDEFSQTVSARLSELADAQIDIDLEIKHVQKELEKVGVEYDSQLIIATQKSEELKQLADGPSVLGMMFESETHLTRIEELSRELIVLRICQSVLSESIESFREKNQDPIVAMASECFREITCGAFESLQVDYDGDSGQPKLVGVRKKDRKAVPINAMSDGTCDQLYLSLRLASVRAWSEKHEPIPLIVDDILINFDDARSIATLNQLAKLSDHTQVILFTHHRHLVDLTINHLDREKSFCVTLQN